MKIFTLCLGIAFIAMSTPLFSQMDYVENELLIQFEPRSDVDAIVNQYKNITGSKNDLKVEKLLSKPMNIYLLRFDAESTSAKALLRIFRADKAVLNAQLNHYVYPRETTPDDENFDQQWHHVNDGSNGGILNSDIGSDQAWDISTGGLTALGDTIVACVIEGGNLLHPDLIGNAWFNYGEIPENGIDDDENGYVDDYRGWDVSTQTDEGVYNGGHGTNVMGMIGAKGNNGLGAAGANWDVKIMSVSGENLFDEASVIEAYTYPLVQRQLYDETGGERGAFVVVTNASWGIDNGNPDDVPLWAAYYDTLGTYGILSCGATANNNVNIDEVGDIPTGVDSEYMVSVTATNNADIRTFSGFGIETVDLGAPGEDVYTTAGANGYTNTSGTSFASPLTAGVIALLYSAPCESFAQMVRDNPQLGADYVRYALFNGVDPVDNLADEVLTGGRLNAFNSLEILVDNCGADLCLPPFAFDYTLSDDTVYTFTWNISNEADAALRYRIEGENEWTYLEGISNSEYVFSELNLCATYEVEIASQCDPEENVENLVFSSTQTFETLGCCIAPALVAESEVAETTANLTWETDFAITGYEVYFKLSTDDEFELAGTSEDGTFILENLEECAFYDVIVVQNCSEEIEAGFELSFRTKGCGHCIDAEFCATLGEN
ncbi:MAG TPA: S8 family serine peptidase, partial [Cryomorphaceae bacterium]|nr:S8 family serine peptidase [Cryomorphaceae bacterium]